MDDLASMITQFLGSEEGMNQLRSVAEALGLNDQQDGASSQGAPPPPQNTAPPPVSGGGLPDLSALLGGLGKSSQSHSSPVDLNTALMLGKAMSAIGQDDRNTQLLRALKPHFSAERAKKVDDAIRILQLIRLLPILRDSGLLGSSKGGDST